MKMKLFVVGFLILSGAGATTDLFACGAKFLMADALEDRAEQRDSKAHLVGEAKPRAVRE